MGLGRQIAATPGTSATQTNSGTITFTYTWDGGWLHLPPPSKVWVHEMSAATWGANGDTHGSKTGSSSTGLSDTIVDLSTPDGLSAGQTANGSKWEQEDASSGTFTVSISPQATLSLSQPPLVAGEDPLLAQQGGGIALSAATAIGDRTIITNETIETSYYKTYDPNTSEPTLAHHDRSSDGSISTDTAAFWQTAGPNTSQGWNITGSPFHANAPFDQTTYSWTASDGSIDDGPVGTGGRSDTLFSLSKPDESSFPLSVTVKVKATGANSGEKDGNTFTMMVHLPLEKTKHLSTVKSGVILQTLMEDVAPGQQEIKQARKATKLDVAGAVDGVAAYFTFTGQEEFAFAAEIVKSFAAFTKLEYEVSGEDEWKGGENSGAEWFTALADNMDGYNVVHVPDCPAVHHADGWLFCKLAVKTVAHNQDDTWQADGYDSHGFNGSGHTVTAHQTIDVEDEPFYYQYKSIPPDWPNNPWPPVGPTPPINFTPL